MNVQQALPLNIEPIDGTLLSAVTILDRRIIERMDDEQFATLWADVHRSTQARLTTAVARFYLENHDVTFHDEPPFCSLAWDGQPDAVGYVLSAMALKHVDLSHALVDHDIGAGEWIRLYTKCGCESRSMRYPAPLPQTIHKTLLGGGVRTYRKGLINTFGATVYNEV